MLKREVQPSRDPSPECVHYNPGSGWVFLFFTIMACVITGAIAYRLGNNTGYSDGFHHGGFYDKCNGKY